MIYQRNVSLSFSSAPENPSICTQESRSIFGSFFASALYILLGFALPERVYLSTL
jgi:hypothetical protein